MNNRPKNCWEFWNCPEEIRKNCEVFKLKAGNKCWFMHTMAKGCKRTEEIGGCFTCEWFKKNNPDIQINNKTN